MKKYFDIFNSIETVHDGWIGSTGVTDDEILFAVYSYEDYSGSAFLLYERDGKLYEVHDAHCSCYGLENWEPEETSWDALKMRDYINYGQEANAAFEVLVNDRSSKS